MMSAGNGHGHGGYGGYFSGVNIYWHEYFSGMDIFTHIVMYLFSHFLTQNMMLEFIIILKTLLCGFTPVQVGNGKMNIFALIRT